MKLGGDYMANDDIRYEAARRGVRLWQIAEAIGINDGNFSRKLRHELPAEDKARILAHRFFVFSPNTQSPYKQLYTHI